MKCLTWLRSTALWFSLGYGLFMATALPLLWFEWWNLPAHLGLFGVSLLPFLTHFLRNRARELESKRGLSVTGTLLIAASLGTGVYLQRHSIYHYYATHDPSAYLNSTQNLARTGSVLHKSTLVRSAYGEGKSDLIPVLGLRESSEPWHSTKNYGVLPKDLAQGVSTFHGLFGAPVFMAASLKTIGDSNFLRIQWLHFIAANLLLAALISHFIPKSPVLTAAATLLFSGSALVAFVYREPLSEPLAVVYFLGILFGLLQQKNNRTLGNWIVSLCLLGALCTRISALFYVPFLVLASAVLPNATKKQRVALFAGVTASTLVAMVLIFRFASTYAADTLVFYTALAEKIATPRFVPFFAIATLVLVGVLLASRGRLTTLAARFFTNSSWTRLWYVGFACIGVAVLIRYIRLATVLSHNIGGYPFVLFNLDSLIFYGSPAVVIFGFGVWIWKLSKKPEPQLLFLQGFIPFVLFFYGAFRFMPLNTQPNFQRYLVIELLPLAIIGFSIGSELLLIRKRKTVWVTAIFAFSLTWNALLAESINHPGISSEARTFYREIDSKLGAMEATGEKPVIALVAADWLEMAVLQPFANGYGKPVVLLRSPFSHETSVALDTLIREGYSPLLAVPSRLLLDRRSPMETTRGWVETDQWRTCYEYPKFGLGAPPKDLTKNCAAFTVFKSERLASKPKRTVRPSWYYRTKIKPEQIWDWYGMEVYGPSICLRSDLPKVEVGISYDPELTFVAPSVSVNGKSAGAMQAKPTGSGKTKHSTEVWLSLDAGDFDCTKWNTVDVLLPPGLNHTRRLARLIDARFEGRSLYETEDALQLFP